MFFTSCLRQGFSGLSSNMQKGQEKSSSPAENKQRTGRRLHVNLLRVLHACCLQPARAACASVRHKSMATDGQTGNPLPIQYLCMLAQSCSCLIAATVGTFSNGFYKWDHRIRFFKQACFVTFQSEHITTVFPL